MRDNEICLAIDIIIIHRDGNSQVRVVIKTVCLGIQIRTAVWGFQLRLEEHRVLEWVA